MAQSRKANHVLTTRIKEATNIRAAPRSATNATMQPKITSAAVPGLIVGKAAGDMTPLCAEMRGQYKAGALG
jgi:hypothetical protein